MDAPSTSHAEARRAHRTLASSHGCLIIAASIATMCGCTGESAPAGTANSRQLAIASRALTSPALTILAPSTGTVEKVMSGGKTAVLLALKVHHLPTLRAHLYLDGVLVQIVTNPGPTANATVSGIGPGLHTLGAILADDSGAELHEPTARAVVRVAIVAPCTLAADCDDGIACSAQSCVTGLCSYVAVPGCCGSTFDCAAGVACAKANTAGAACQACESETECDDGNVCTVDTCAIGLGLCSHARPPETCCSDTECPSDDPCRVGFCHDGNCALVPDLLRPDCCSKTTNPACDDELTCTLDACSTPMPGWTSCTHELNVGKAGCCDPLGGATCQDGKPCTYDMCDNAWKCLHLTNATCCATPADCDDGHPCTADACNIVGSEALGKCSHASAATCCGFAADCDDGVACTVDACALADSATGTCIHKLGEGCCVDDADCDDAKTCTSDVCINQKCVFSKKGAKGSCCDANQDCSDNDACTLDTCQVATHKCVYVDGGDPGCCNFNSDCDTGTCTLKAFCGYDNQCHEYSGFYPCDSAQDCDDSDKCTLDTCDFAGDSGTCTHKQQPGCCGYDGACQDDDPCTKDSCTAYSCMHAKLAGCCIGGPSAVVVCDDGIPCTQDSCLGQFCHHFAPANGCCQQDSDCNDGNSCSQIAACSKGVCIAQGESCDDGNSCTIDACIDGVCKFESIPGCCQYNADCEDDNACTVDLCAQAAKICVHPLVQPGCCAVGSGVTGTSCAHLDGPCVTGTCVAVEGQSQPAGTGQCVAAAVLPCFGPFNHCQDFSGAAQWAGLAWKPVNVAGNAAANWTLGPGGALGADNAARFSWTPSRLNFHTCLRSPIVVPPPLGGAQVQDVTMQLRRAWTLAAGAASTLSLRVVHWPASGTNVADAALLASVPIDDSEGPGPIALTLSGIKLGAGPLRLGLCVAGQSSAPLAAFVIDDVCVGAGKAPTFTLCPSARTVKAGQVVDIPLRGFDPDAGAKLTFSVPLNIDFASILPLTAIPKLDQRALLRLKPSDDDGGHHRFEIQVSDGVLRGTCPINVTVLATQGVVVWKPSEVPMAMAQPIVDGLRQLGRSAHVIEDLGTYVDLSAFDAVFVVLGVYPARHVLTEKEAAKLGSYLQGAGRLYLEGGETWAYDPKTQLHAMFAAQGLADAAPAGMAGQLQGHSNLALPTAAGPGSATAPANWSYESSATFDNLNDLLGLAPGPARAGLLRLAGSNPAWVQVAIAPPVAGYRAVASSVALAGVRAGALPPIALLARLLAFFDLGLPTCASAGDCEDGDPCTTHACVSGVCGVGAVCP